MKRVLSISFITAMALTPIIAEDLNIKSGWQLIGAPNNIILEKLNNKCLDYLWSYKNSGWSVYIANDKEYDTSSNLNSLNRADGFWAYGNSDCNITINDIIDTKLSEDTPYITTTSTPTINENETEVTKISSLGTEKSVTYSIDGGSEYYLFDIANGKLIFKETPNFEAPQDIDKDNIYEIRLKVSDGELSSMKTLNVKVNDINDKFQITSKFYTKVYLWSGEFNSGVIYYNPTYLYNSEDVTFNDAKIECNQGESRIESYVVAKGYSMSDYSADSCTISFSATDGKDILNQNLSFELIGSAIGEEPKTNDINLTVKPNVAIQVPFSGSDPQGYNITLHPEYTTKVSSEASSYDNPAKGKLEKKNGKWYYIADSDAIGIDSFKYYAFNGVKSNKYNSSIVTIKVVDNFAPILQDMEISTLEESEIIIELNAKDDENDYITYTLETPKNGTLTKVDNDTYKYLPNKDFFGIEIIKFKANDGKSDSNDAFIKINVTDVNDAPIIETPPILNITPIKLKSESGESNVIDEASLFLSQSTLVRDADRDDVTIEVVTKPQYGTVKFYPDGGYVYAPNFDYEGIDNFTYKVIDKGGESKTQTITLNVKSPFKIAKRVIPATGSIMSTNEKGAKRGEVDAINDDPTTKRGVARNYERINDGIVIDHVTGLMWQDNGDNIQNEVKTDNFAKKEVNTLKRKLMKYANAEAYCANMTLGGYSDWRLPSEAEARTIIDYGVQYEATLEFDLGTAGIFILGKPATQNGLFQYLAPDIGGIPYIYGYYFTTTKDYRNGAIRRFAFGSNYSGSALNIELEQKYSNITPKLSIEEAVTKYNSEVEAGALCVRGDYDTKSEFIKDSEERILLDTTTNLMWQDTYEYLKNTKYLNSDGTYQTAGAYGNPFKGSLSEAVEYCENLELGGYSDWSLPNANEIQTLSHDSLKETLDNKEVMNSNKEYGAREFQFMSYASSTPSKLSPNDPIEYIYFDDNGNIVTDTNEMQKYAGYKMVEKLPWFIYGYQDEEIQAKFRESNDTTESFFYGGVDWKACRAAEFKGGSTYYESDGGRFNPSKGWDKNDTNTLECRRTAAKFCRINNEFYECRSNAGSPNNEGFAFEMPHGQRYYDGSVKCAREASSDDIKNFYDNMKNRFLNTPPKFSEWEYDKESKKITNKINGYSYDRFIQSLDGNVTDKMSGVTLLKIFDNPKTSWSDADSKAKALGEGWRLPNKNHTAYLKDWINSGEITVSKDFFDKDSSGNLATYNDEIWLSKEYNSTEAHKYNPIASNQPIYAYSKYNIIDKNYLISEKPFIKMFPIKSNEIEAVAPNDMIAKAGESITLDGSGSFEGLSGNVSYEWGYIFDGTIVNIQNANGKVATVTLPNVKDEVNIRFTLSIKRDYETSYDEMNVIIRNSTIKKLDTNGNELPYEASKFTCLKDSESGLIWEVKMDSNKDRLYDYSSIVLPSDGTCGISGWRIPTKAEFDDAKNKDYLRNSANVMNRERTDMSIDGLYDYGTYDLYWMSDSAILNIVATNNGANKDNYYSAGRHKAIRSGDTFYAESILVEKSDKLRVWAVGQ